MAELAVGDARLHYEVGGDGYPVLLLAPGGMRSMISMWDRMPWNPASSLRDGYRVIGMDQRNAGASHAPVRATDGWHTYAQDQLALLDHLGAEQCHLIGMCIGGPFVFGLLATAPERVRAAVVLQPVGVDGNRPVLRKLFDDWVAEVSLRHPEAGATTWTSFGDNMWNGDFVLTAGREEVAACETPLLVLMGDDQYHPQSVSRDIATLAPNATLVERWKDTEVITRTDATIKAFLAAQSR